MHFTFIHENHTTSPFTHNTPQNTPHSKVKAVEFMVCDALRAADRSLHFTDHIHDPKRYVQLDDGLLRTIRNFDLLVPDAANRAEYAGLREAQGVLDRLEKRKLYRYVWMCRWTVDCGLCRWVVCSVLMGYVLVIHYLAVAASMTIATHKTTSTHNNTHNNPLYPKQVCDRGPRAC